MATTSPEADPRPRPVDGTPTLFELAEARLRLHDEWLRERMQEAREGRITYRELYRAARLAREYYDRWSTAIEKAPMVTDAVLVAHMSLFWTLHQAEAMAYVIREESNLSAWRSHVLEGGTNEAPDPPPPSAWRY